MPLFIMMLFFHCNNFRKDYINALLIFERFLSVAFQIMNVSLLLYIIFTKIQRRIMLCHIVIGTSSWIYSTFKILSFPLHPSPSIIWRRFIILDKIQGQFLPTTFFFFQQKLPNVLFHLFVYCTQIFQQS